EGRPQRRIRLGYRIGLVADDRAMVVLVPDLPVRGVGAREGEVRSGVTRRVERVAHRLAPVLVVPRDDDETVLEEALWMLVRVDVGLVRHVVPLPFEEPHEVVLGLERD